MMQNLQNHMVPNTLTFDENAIIWYRSLLLNRALINNMTGFDIDNSILIVYGMCPPVNLTQYLGRGGSTAATHGQSILSNYGWMVLLRYN